MGKNKKRRMKNLSWAALDIAYNHRCPTCGKMFVGVDWFCRPSCKKRINR